MFNETYEYDAKFLSITRKAVLVEIGKDKFAFSLNYCNFEPSPLDLTFGEEILVKCPDWLAEKMGIDSED
jgi:hypothetical protein